MKVEIDEDQIDEFIVDNPKEREKRHKEWYAELKKDVKWVERENNRKRAEKQKLKELKALGVVKGK